VQQLQGAEAVAGAAISALGALAAKPLGPIRGKKGAAAAAAAAVIAPTAALQIQRTAAPDVAAAEEGDEDDEIRMTPAFAAFQRLDCDVGMDEEAAVGLPAPIRPLRGCTAFLDGLTPLALRSPAPVIMPDPRGSLAAALVKHANANAAPEQPRSSQAPELAKHTVTAMPVFAMPVSAKR